MGFLDRQSRVVDIVLTERGRKLFSTGKLDFAFFGLFDDGIDYDPYSPDGLDADGRRTQIDSTPMTEVRSVPDVRSLAAPGEPRNHVFTAAADYSEIPRLSIPAQGEQFTVQGDQRRQGESYARTASSVAGIDLVMSGDVEPGGQSGFIVRVFSSASSGLSPLELRLDMSGRRSADPFLAVAFDGEVVSDRSATDKSVLRVVPVTVVKR